jgi:peptidyl-prolyl cis-trans isomerase SDCCAG10
MFFKFQMKYKSKKVAKKGSAREEMTLALLSKFTSKLRSVPEEVIDESLETKSAEAAAATSTINKLRTDSDDEDELAGDSWLGHRLTFAAEKAILAKDANTKGDDWFDIYDPRNPVNKRRREQTKKK